MPGIADACIKLKAEGWKVSEQSILKGLETEDSIPSTYQDIKKLLLNTDIKDVVDNKVSDETPANIKKQSSVSGPLVLQVCKVRNVCAAKSPEGGEISTGARLLRVTFTDGTTPYHGIEMSMCPAISPNTAPGTKVQLVGRVPQNGGFLLLAPRHITVLGGRVDALYDKWKLTESVLSFASYRQQPCVNSDGSRPPPWIPFNEGSSGGTPNGKEALQGFKSLRDTVASGREGSGEGGDGEAKEDRFSAQREQAVQELVKSKQNAKVFGGGRHAPDPAVSRVVAAGFSEDVAKWALATHGNDVSAALGELRAAATGQPAPLPWPRKDCSSGGGRGGGGDRGGGRVGRRGRGGRGRGRGGPDGSDDEDYAAVRDAPRPSGPASLFDFFDAKLAERNESITFVEPEKDVRGSTYDRPKERERGGGRGRRSRGGRGGLTYPSSRGAAPRASPPPDLTSTVDWPAPGEEQPAKGGRNTTTSYLQSAAMLEEREEERREMERIAREEQMREARKRAEGDVLGGGVKSRDCRGGSRSIGGGHSSGGGDSSYSGRGGGTTKTYGNGTSGRSSYSNNSNAGVRESSDNDSFQGGAASYGSHDDSVGSSQGRGGRGRGYAGSGRAGGYRGSYDSREGSYDAYRGGYGGHRDGYSSLRDGYEQYSVGYGRNRGGYGRPRGGYEGSRGSYDGSRSDYERSSSGYEKSGGGYEGSRCGYERSKGGYEGSRSVYERFRGGYEGSNSGYDKSGGGYEGSRVSYDGSAGSYSGSRGSYDGSRGSYNGSRGGYDYSGYRGRYDSNRNRGFGGVYQAPQGDRGGLRGTSGTDDSAYSDHASSTCRDRGGGSSSNYTAGQEELIRQFKESVQLQGYTGYIEVEQHQGSSSIGQGNYGN